jgi:hypothetical protein
MLVCIIMVPGLTVISKDSDFARKLSARFSYFIRTKVFVPSYFFLVKCYIWSIALYGAETWTLRAVDQKHLESFEVWCWRKMEKISLTDHVRNKDVLLGVKEQRNILHEIRKRKANWIGHILRRNFLLQRVTEGKIQGGGGGITPVLGCFCLLYM